MNTRLDRRTSVLTGFTAGAVLAGAGLTAFLLIRGPEPARLMGVATLPTDLAGWWALVGLSALLGAVVGVVGALAAWLLSRPRTASQQPRHHEPGDRK